MYIKIRKQHATGLRLLADVDLGEEVLGGLHGNETLYEKGQVLEKVWAVLGNAAVAQPGRSLPDFHIGIT